MKARAPLIYLVVGIIMYSSCLFHANNWQGTSQPGNDKATFTRFSGKNIDKIKLANGDVLAVNYKVNISKGKLLVAIKDDTGLLWKKTFLNAGDSNFLQFKADKETEYKIFIEGDGADGNFDIQYQKKEPKKIQVAINKNIESFGLVMQLVNGEQLLTMTDTVVIENRRTTWKDWYYLTAKNYALYKDFKGAKIVDLYKAYSNKGYTDDFFIGFLLQTDIAPNAKINITTDSGIITAFSPKGDWEEGKKNATEFLAELNSFYNEVSFDAYLNNNAGYYQKIQADVLKNLPKQGFIDTMENFYQKQFNSYTLVPSLNLLTAIGFGKMNLYTKSIYNTFGPFSFQSFAKDKTDLGFDYPEKVQALSIHEFGHSFVNPAIDKIPKDLLLSTEYLYKPIKDSMVKLSYPSWQVCLYEHFVRAGEVTIARKLGNNAQADKGLKGNVASGFIYLPQIVQALEQYAQHENNYPSYDDFVVTVLKNLKEPK